MTKKSNSEEWEPYCTEAVAVRMDENSPWVVRSFCTIKEGKYGKYRCFPATIESAHLPYDMGWKYCEPLNDHFNTDF